MNAYHNFSKDKITMRRADVCMDKNILKQFFAAWARDYIGAGDKCEMPTPLSGSAFLMEDHIYLAHLKQQAVGLLVLREAGLGKCIEIVYVDRRYRSRGFAAQLYKFAIEYCDAQEITLTYQRVLRRVSYWQGLGYKSLLGWGREGYSIRSLCCLSTKEHLYSICAVPLTREAIEKYRMSLGCAYEFKVSCQNNSGSDFQW